MPSAIRLRSQLERSCSSSTTSDPLAIDARRPAGVVQQHQREQADRFRLVGHQVDEQPGQADALGAEVVADGRLAMPLAR